MTNLIILAGIPGCGKSTWAKDLFDLKYRIVSTDAIRQRLFGGLKIAHGEGVKVENNINVFDTFHAEIRDSLQHNIDTIADATNLTKSARQKLQTIARETGAKVHLVLFKNLLEATNRNAARNDDERVPDDVMEHMIEKYWDTLALIAQETYASVTKIERFQ